MYIPDFHFRISNYTDTNTDGSIQKSASLELGSETTHRVNTIVKILLTGHINAREIVNPNKTRKREQIRKKILSELCKEDLGGLDPYNWKKECTAHEIVEALISGRGLPEPFGRTTRRSPSGLNKAESYKLWFDGTYLED